MFKRIFLIVLDSFGTGELPDSGDYGDKGSNTLRAVCSSDGFFAPNLTRLGLFNIDGNGELRQPCASPDGCFGKLAEKSKGKDTTVGHWEIAGVISPKPMPTFYNGFPQEIIDRLEKASGRRVICNKTYSGTEVIKAYGREHIDTGALIVYTSADSVLQIAAHESVVPIAELYDICAKAREIMQGDYAVGRVIARPFIGEYPDFTRTSNRHDFSLAPPKPTMLDVLSENGYNVLSVGKIIDIFAGRGIGEFVRSLDNADGMEKTLDYARKSFKGLCFVNLVDFDAKYGHRNNIDGYARAISDFDLWLGGFMRELNADDCLIITADHGCDPSTVSTDHSREYVPLIVYSSGLAGGVNLGVRSTFADICATVLDNFELLSPCGESFLSSLVK